METKKKLVLERAHIAALVMRSTEPGGKMQTLQPAEGASFGLEDVAAHVGIAAFMLRELGFSPTTVVHFARFFADAAIGKLG